MMRRISMLSACILLAVVATNGQETADALLRGFQNPPNSAKPRVWWHWMNGNIAKEGIRLDLEWMNRVGIGRSAAGCREEVHVQGGATI